MPAVFDLQTGSVISQMEIDSSNIVFGTHFCDVKTIFDKLNGRERLQLLKAVGGLYGHRVIPGTGLGPPTQWGAVSASSRPKAPKMPKNSKSPAMRQIQKEITLCNKEISLASASIGGSKLPNDHALIEKRGHLFRVLQSKRGRVNA